MTTLTLRARGPLPAADCWERYARPELWSEWSPQIARVETDVARIVPGATGRVVSIVGLAVTFRIEEVDEVDRTWSWRAGIGPVRMHLVHGVTTRTDGCATWLRVSGPLPIVLGYAPVAALALRQLVAS